MEALQTVAPISLALTLGMVFLTAATCLIRTSLSPFICPECGHTSARATAATGWKPTPGAIFRSTIASVADAIIASSHTKGTDHNDARSPDPGAPELPGAPLLFHKKDGKAMTLPATSLDPIR